MLSEDYLLTTHSLDDKSSKTKETGVLGERRFFFTTLT